MKIVHIITRLILGGAQENTLITCRELAARGHDVTLITGPAIGPEGHLFTETQKAAFQTIVINELRREIHPPFDLIAYLKINHHLKKIKPDIVHTHSAKAGILGRIAAHRLKGKWRDTNKPAVVHTIHGLAFHPYQNKYVNGVYRAIERFTARRTDAMITVADAMTQKALAAGMGTSEMYTTAYSAIQEEPYLQGFPLEDIKGFRRKHGINEQSIVLVTIARLARLKGHEFIVESARRLAARYENCTWLLVGDGKIADQIRHDIQLKGLGYKFKFTGLIPTSQIPLAIHCSDILVHCSLREGLARVLPQAMLCGKPVVSFDIDGAREVVNKNTGFLIPAEDVDALTDACAKLIEAPQLRKSLGAAGREFVTEKFAPKTMTDTIESVYSRFAN